MKYLLPFLVLPVMFFYYIPQNEIPYPQTTASSLIEDVNTKDVYRRNVKRVYSDGTFPVKKSCSFYKWDRTPQGLGSRGDVIRCR